MIIGTVGCFVAILRHGFDRHSSAESPARNERDKPSETLKRIENEPFTAGDLEIDLSMRLVKRRGRIVKLTPTEHELLTYFVSSAGRLLTHSELLHHVWGPE